jgi:membrane protein
MRLYKPGRKTEPQASKKEQASRWKLGGLTPWQLLTRLYSQIDADDVLTLSEALAYYFVCALFPMIFFLTAVLGLFARSHDLQSGLLSYASRLMPADAYQLVQKTLQEIANHSSGMKLVLGLALALWSGSGAVSSIMDALNRCYHVNDARQWWKRKLVSIGLTVALSTLTIAALVLVLYGGEIADFVGEKIGLSALSLMAWRLIEWPIAFFFIIMSFALVYFWGPDARQQWRWITPGSLAGVLVWLGASMLFRVYLHFFNSYTNSYGSLGAMIVLLFWLYIAGLAILLGGEINSEIENAAVRQGHSEAQPSVEKKL